MVPPFSRKAIAIGLCQPQELRLHHQQRDLFHRNPFRVSMVGVRVLALLIFVTRVISDNKAAAAA